ncbi:AMP-binding protein [Shewanella sp. SNU WT4]|uniref:AMP-binding protein n=1 Tax=Shewanella sp. SNU WT4 TaxID=2590015 RepID=UPI001F0DB6C0|nr:AMP-binding protein [Shewanella sp. SNU WT4]
MASLLSSDSQFALIENGQRFYAHDFNPDNLQLHSVSADDLGADEHCLCHVDITTTYIALAPSGIAVGVGSLAKPRCSTPVSSTASTTPIVALMIQAMHYAESNNIPLILNRTQQALDIHSVPKHFAIGLLTSGTTGQPKLVFHALAKLLPSERPHPQNDSQSHSAANLIHAKLIQAKPIAPKPANTWLLCYHPMSYAGLQVILQAIVSEDTLVAALDASLQAKAHLAHVHNINAISATPSMLRALLLSWQTYLPPLTIITLGGEIADQRTLDTINNVYPNAQIRHIYATTEAGVVFTVKDRRAGFPRAWLENAANASATCDNSNGATHGWQLIAGSTLRLTKGQVEIDTGDCIDISQDRVLFTGRIDNLVNVGGVKVNLEALERQIMQLPEISDARVYAKANPITGALVCVELCAFNQTLAAKALNELCLQLEPAARPRIITFSDNISLSSAGKKQRFLQ